MTHILVAYATKSGSTQEVAEYIGTVLQEDGADLELCPAKWVRERIEGYDLVMLGAPLYSGRWHRDAHRFLKRHREELGRVPVWVFGMGARSGSPEAWRKARFQLDRALAKRAWLQPIASTVFGGVDPPDTDGVRRDLRDWDQIRAWASDVSRSIESSHKQPHWTGRSADVRSRPGPRVR